MPAVIKSKDETDDDTGQVCIDKKLFDLPKKMFTQFMFKFHVHIYGVGAY